MPTLYPSVHARSIVPTPLQDRSHCGIHASSDGAARRAKYLELASAFCDKFEVSPTRRFHQFRVAAVTRCTPWPRFPQPDSKAFRAFTYSPGSQYIFNDEARVVFAINPKVMSTSSKLIVDALKNDGVVPHHIPAHEALNYLAEASVEKQREVLANYTRVMFIRNPYARLYSAWTNKYRDMPDTCKEVVVRGETRVRCNPFYRNWVNLGIKMLEHSSIDLPDNDQDILRAVKWHVFLKGVIDQAAQDKHWKNQVRPGLLLHVLPSVAMTW